MAMRKQLLAVAGLSLMLVACGGGEKPAEQAATPEAAPAAAPAAGATHDVNMQLDGTAYHYVPAELTIKVGDVVVFHNISGGPHYTQFWPDSIPAGAAEPLGAGMPDVMGPLAGPLIVEPNGTYTITFANVPVGDYKFYCLPHLANKMFGKITVTQ
jgi:plastocyanin